MNYWVKAEQRLPPEGMFVVVKFSDTDDTSSWMADKNQIENELADLKQECRGLLVWEDTCEGDKLLNNGSLN